MQGHWYEVQARDLRIKWFFFKQNSGEYLDHSVLKLGTKVEYQIILIIPDAKLTSITQSEP